MYVLQENTLHTQNKPGDSFPKNSLKRRLSLALCFFSKVFNLKASRINAQRG